MTDIRIDPLDNRAPPVKLAWQREIDAICAKHAVDWHDVRGPRHFSKLIPARREIVVMLRHRGWSFPQIGRVLNRDHSTAVHHYQRGTMS